MKSVFAAIGAALRSAFSIMSSVVMFPLRLAGSLFGPSVPPPPAGDSEMVEDLKSRISAEQAKAIEDAADRVAKCVSNWIMDCVIEDKLLPVPRVPIVSRSVANWLPGLTRDEAETLVNCEISQIRDHVAGKTLIEGVRPVQKLEAKEWELAAPEPAWDPCVAEPLFVTHAAACGVP